MSTAAPLLSACRARTTILKASTIANSAQKVANQRFWRHTQRQQYNNTKKGSILRQHDAQLTALTDALDCVDAAVGRFFLMTVVSLRA